MEDRPKKPGRPGKPFRSSPAKAGGPRDGAAGPRKPRTAGAGEGKPGGGRPEGRGKAPFKPRREGDGEGRSAAGGKPFSKPRREGGAPAEGEGRRFSKTDRPFRKDRDGEAAAGAKPFRKFDKPFAKPRRDGERAGPAAPYRPGKRERETGGDGQPEAGERIAKRLARAGVASRRDAEAMIEAGRIRVNGKVLDTPALNVTSQDSIEIDGAPIPAIERTRLFLFHKPAGVVTTNRDPEGRQTVFDVLPRGLPRLMSIGRLDINTEGLLLLTNDGGLSRVLELPSTGWLRRYRVRVHGRVDEAALAGLAQGIAVDGVFYGAIEAELERVQGSNAWIMVGLREGKNREVKNVMGALGLDVTRLIRVSYGPFQLGDLAEGAVQELKGRHLRDQLGERLVAESGANFDAPIVNEFTNAPARSERRREEGEERRPARKPDRDARRESALDRLDTRARPAGGKGGPKKGAPSRGGFAAGPGKKEERPADKPRSRTSNVWMAPGARPLGEKKLAERAERGEGRRYAGKPKPLGGAMSGGGKPGGPKGVGRPGGAGQRGSGGPSRPRKRD
jgi:23S rRNA pseudouridine2605 synthase